MNLFWEINRPSSMKKMIEIGILRFLDVFQRYEKWEKGKKQKELEIGQILVQHQHLYYKKERGNCSISIFFFFQLDNL